MKIVADTDILSTFARIRRLDILNGLFEQVITPQAVLSELKNGSIDIKGVHLQIVRLARDELKALKKADARLDRGEKECFVIAKHRGLPLSSNEKVVHSLCEEEGIGYFSLSRLLRLAILKKVVSREEAMRLIKQIEKEEGTIIKNKERYSSDSMKVWHLAKLYSENKITLGRAAMYAGVSVRKMMDYLKHKKIPAQYDIEDLEQDTKRFYQRMGR